MASNLDEEGREILDSQPMAVPPGFKVPETMEQMMRRLLRSPEFANAADMAGEDTFEEAEDFEVDDDTFDPHSPYEAVFDPVLGRDITHEEFVRNRQVYEQRYQKAYDEAYKRMDLSDALRARLKPEPPAEQSGRAAPPKGAPTKGEGESGS